MCAPSSSPVFGVEHRLDEAFRFAERNRLAIADEGEFADLHGIARFLRLGFGQADAGDLRMAIGAAGNILGVHRVRMAARNRFGRDHAFMARLVREPGRLRYIANRIDACNARLTFGSR
jgi:hypothetical protein